VEAANNQNPQNQIRQRQTISSDLKNRIIQYLCSNTTATISGAARTFGVAVSTASGILRRYESRGNTNALPKGGARHIKIHQAALNVIEIWVNERPNITLCQIKERLGIEHNIFVTEGAISVALIKRGLTVKILRTMPISRNCTETIQARFEYAQTFLNEAPADRHNIVWIDECGFNLHMRHKCGRS
jgi:transposase